MVLEEAEVAWVTLLHGAAMGVKARMAEMIVVVSMVGKRRVEIDM